MKRKADVRHPLQRAIFGIELDAKGKLLWFTQVGFANLPTQVSLAIRPDHKILVGASSTGTITTRQAKVTLKGESVMLALLDAANGEAAASA